MWTPRYVELRDKDGKLMQRTVQYEEDGPIELLFSKKQENPTTQIDSTGKAAVDHNSFWQPISTCPRGAKVQLLGKGGVAMYGEYHGKDKFYTHWAPLPKLKKQKT